MNVAIVVGGSIDVLTEFDAATRLCHEAGASWDTFVVNDLIGDFPQVDYAVTLHPEKLHVDPIDWLGARRRRQLPWPKDIWAHRHSHHGTSSPVTQIVQKFWPGSVGLLAVQIALEEIHYDKIILTGVPMTLEGKHIKRRVNWSAVRTFWPEWVSRAEMLRPHVRSMSGQTAELLGKPCVQFICD